MLRFWKKNILFKKNHIFENVPTFKKYFIFFIKINVVPKKKQQIKKKQKKKKKNKNKNERKQLKWAGPWRKFVQGVCAPPRGSKRQILELSCPRACVV